MDAEVGLGLNDDSTGNIWAVADEQQAADEAAGQQVGGDGEVGLRERAEARADRLRRRHAGRGGGG